MTKCCPIMSNREKSWGEENCLTENCALWDEERKQCCIKSMALAAAGKSSGESGSTAQAYYIPPSSYCYTDARSNIHVETDLINNPVYNGGL